MALPSRPPLAQSEPSGETVTVFKYELWPWWLVRNLQLAKFQTCESIGRLVDRQERRDSYFHKFIPTSWDDQGVFLIGTETHGWNPVGVIIVDNGVFA